MPTRSTHPRTPDGRYFVVRGRLWRLADPGLSPEHRASLVAALMDARRGLQRQQTDPAARAAARERVDVAKVALGERGPVWWTDGAPDFNRKRVENTPYAAWFTGLQSEVDDGPADRPVDGPAGRSAASLGD